MKLARTRGNNKTLTYAGEGSNGRSQKQPENQQPTKRNKKELRVNQQNAATE